MKILGIDLGTTSTKSASTLLDTETGELQRSSFPTSIESFVKLFNANRPGRVVVEPTPSTGLIVDLCQAMDIEIVVANTRDGAWKNRTSKTDKRDADLLARLSASGQLRTIHVPERDVREWRSLIAFRHHLVRARTRIKNHIKALLRNEFVSTRQLWNTLGLTMMRLLAKPLHACDSNEIWRGQLHTELLRLKQTQDHMNVLETRLDQMGRKSSEVKLLTEIDGIGPRCAEAIVATLGDPLRFKSRKHVAAYIGLCPRVEQSGDRTIHGRITKCGNTLLRSLLVEVAWLGVRRDSWMREIYEQIARGDTNRRKRAVVAVARRILVKCWAMLRDLKKPPKPPSSKKSRAGRPKAAKASSSKRAAA